MSQRGNDFDNVYTKSSWSRCKAKLLAGGHFRGLAEDTLEIGYYSAGVYYSPDHCEIYP